MLMHKLLTQDMTSHAGCKWELGVTKRIRKPGKTMCTNQVLHCYNNPYLALLLNPLHANISNPRLFLIETTKPVATDGLKYATKQQTLVKELSIPSITTEQRVEFAVRAALLVYKDKSFVSWANGWLSGKDRGKEAAANAAAYAARDAAYAAAAYVAAAYVAAKAARDAANAAAYAARDAAYAAAAYAAANAATAADYAADAAAYKDPVKFNQELLKIVKEVFGSAKY